MTEKLNNELTPRSLTIEDFESKYLPQLNNAAELILSHPDIPDEIDQAEILGALNTLSGELRADLEGRVPEIVKLQEKIARLEKQNLKLQDTNQQLFIKIGTPPDPSKQKEDIEPPKKSWEEIEAIIKNLG